MSSSPLKGNIIPTTPNLQRLEMEKNKPLKIEAFFKEELSRWCRINNRTREAFCEQLGKRPHWAAKVISGSWNMHVNDLPQICALLKSDRLIELVEENYRWENTHLRIQEIDAKEAELVKEISRLRSERRMIKLSMEVE